MIRWLKLSWRVSWFLRKHEDELLNELLSARDGSGFPVSFGHRGALRRLFTILVRSQ